MSRVIVIGGGASGLVAAIIAARNNNEVIILEKNNTCGKKILLTGNGKCNFWNLDQNNKHYHSNNKEILDIILSEKNKTKVLDFFDSLNLIYKSKKGYLYPNSNQATTILDLLLDEAKICNVKIVNNIEVLNIKFNNKFLIKTNSDYYESEKLILATGSCAYPKTGSDGKGYLFAQMFNHKIIKPIPALVQLKIKGNYLKEWAGIRQDVIVSNYENGILKRQEIGEIQLTKEGISGICVMQLSSNIARGLDKNIKEEILINFLPMFTEQKLYMYLEKVKNKSIKQVLNAMLNKKLVKIILDKNKISDKIIYRDLKEDLQQNLLIDLLNFKVEIIGTKDFNNAQICSGGVSLKEINPQTMESRLQKNLYFTGELIDCNGDCGGYNLGFAWLTGIIAGENND